MSNVFTAAFTAATKDRANAFVQRVSQEFPELAIETIELTDGNNQMPTGAVVSVLFDNDFSSMEAHTKWLRQADDGRATTPMLPIALGDHGVPPAPIDRLKSRFSDRDESEIMRSIGAMMGLTLCPGRSKIFVSYRSGDGRSSATKIYNHLISRGYCAWLDEGKDIDGSSNLEWGREVQEEIEQRLTEANAVILVDTPQAPSSYWVREEMKIALGKMIPIYPVVLHPITEETSRGRFRVLQGLRHCSEITSWNRLSC